VVALPGGVVYLIPAVITAEGAAGEIVACEALGQLALAPVESGSSNISNPWPTPVRRTCRTKTLEENNSNLYSKSLKVYRRLMWILGERYTEVVGATPVPARCGNCNNDTHFQLHSSKMGPGLAIPLTQFFTHKYMLAYKAYFDICPICSAMEKVSRDEARGRGA